MRLLLERGANPLLDANSGGGIYRSIYGMDKETKDAVSALLLNCCFRTRGRSGADFAVDK